VWFADVSDSQKLIPWIVCFRIFLANDPKKARFMGKSFWKIPMWGVELIVQAAGDSSRHLHRACLFCHPISPSACVS
jgi:hypothetical protein